MVILILQLRLTQAPSRRENWRGIGTGPGQVGGRDVLWWRMMTRGKPNYKKMAVLEGIRT